jgi:hypothetical protein
MSVDKSNEKNYSTDVTPVPIRYTVMPGISSPIVLKTLPNAVCTLQREGESISDSSLKIYSDEDGIVSFYVSPDIESNDIAKVVLRCEVQEKVLYYPIELRSSFEPTNEMPSPSNEDPKPLQKKDNEYTRPALSEEEILNLSDEELLKRNYPPRPDSKESPEAFYNWRKIVSVPTNEVKPNVVTNHGVSHSLGQFHDGARHWSGYVLRGEFKKEKLYYRRQYKEVSGSWRVPVVGPDGSDNRSYSSLWVGLGGWGGDRDLVQAGTAHNKIVSDGTWSITFSSYYVWTEFLPKEPYEQIITNFRIHPGDEIHVYVYVGTPRAPPSITGSHCVFYIQNFTTHKSVTIETPKEGTDSAGKPVRFDTIGGEAVWIMEAPLHFGFYADLANYGTATMFNAHTIPEDIPSKPFSWISYLSGASLQVTMTNSPKVLSTVKAIDSQSMRFTWHASY